MRAAKLWPPCFKVRGLQPLLIVPPDAEHLIDSYRQLKHLAVFAGVECTIAALEAPLSAEGPRNMTGAASKPVSRLPSKTPSYACSA